jgi:hypothetical protein
MSICASVMKLIIIYIYIANKKITIVNMEKSLYTFHYNNNSHNNNHYKNLT